MKQDDGRSTDGLTSLLPVEQRLCRVLLSSFSFCHRLLDLCYLQQVGRPKGNRSQLCRETSL